MKLAWDMARCQGEGCELRDECARHQELADLGPRTPVHGALCDPAEGGWPQMIPATRNDTPPVSRRS